MTNAYSNLTDIKRLLFEAVVTDTTWDAELLAKLVASSRAIDDHCKRQFWVESATRYFDGSGKVLLVDDLLTVTTLKTDADGNATFENTFAAADYHLYPLNRWPKMSIELSYGSDYASFAKAVKKGVEIVGVWGFGDGKSASPWLASGTSTAEELDASETGVDVSDGTLFKAGQTIRVESEDMYVSSISSNTLTVRRGVNGTTAATHATSKAVSIAQYPEVVTQACLVQAIRWQKRRESGFQTVVGGPFGPVRTERGLDPDVQMMLSRYVREEAY